MKKNHFTKTIYLFLGLIKLKRENSNKTSPTLTQDYQLQVIHAKSTLNAWSGC
ncbi:MAG: hypothetical protein ABWY22_08925 [Flavobacterium sp.]